MPICPNCQIKVREQIIKQHLEEGISIPQLAKIAGRHENTLYAWKAKYLRRGSVGLKGESRAPKHHPNEYSEEVKGLIRRIRHKGLREEKRYLGEKIIAYRLERDYGVRVSHSGVGKFLQSDGLISEQRKRRPKKERVEKCRIHDPGELLQMDVKYAAKNVLGQWFYQYDAIDYMTGIVIGEIYPIQSTYESVRFLEVVVRRSPFAIKGLQTDNHSTFTNYYTGYQKSADPSKPRLHALDLACARNDIVHYLIDPGKPAQNGKIERFHRTTEDEFWQRETFNDLNSLKRKFRDYLHYYNNEREHSTFNYLTPLEKLRTFPKYENIKKVVN